jgi:hypothetical protein
VVGHPNVSLFVPTYLGSLDNNYIIFRKFEISKNKKSNINFFTKIFLKKNIEILKNILFIELHLCSVCDRALKISDEVQWSNPMDYWHKDCCDPENLQQNSRAPLEGVTCKV